MTKLRILLKYTNFLVDFEITRGCETTRVGCATMDVSADQALQTGYHLF